MKKLLTFLSSVVLCGSAFAQSVIVMPVEQNPVFEVSSNRVSIVAPDDMQQMVLGGDLVVTGGSGNYQYKWYDGTGKELGTESTLAINNRGSYFLDIKDTCDCLQTVRFDVVDTGIKTVSNSDFSVYPNPTDGVITISGFNAVQVCAVDMSGRLAVIAECDKDFRADLSSLTPGAFILTVSDDAGRTAVARIIKK